MEHTTMIMISDDGSHTVRTGQIHGPAVPTIKHWVRTTYTDNARMTLIEGAEVREFSPEITRRVYNGKADDLL